MRGSRLRAWAHLFVVGLASTSVQYKLRPALFLYPSAGGGSIAEHEYLIAIVAMTGKSIYYQILEKGYTQEELDQVIYLLNSPSEKPEIPEVDREHVADKADSGLLSSGSLSPGK